MRPSRTMAHSPPPTVPSPRQIRNVSELGKQPRNGPRSEWEQFSPVVQQRKKPQVSNYLATILSSDVKERK